MVMKCFRICSI